MPSFERAEKRINLPHFQYQKYVDIVKRNVLETMQSTLRICMRKPRLIMEDDPLLGEDRIGYDLVMIRLLSGDSC
jgi:hypothetical protein